MVRAGTLDAALIRAELVRKLLYLFKSIIQVLEPFVLLAAGNKAIHQAAHNRIFTRSLSAELIYSLSPNRNISESLNSLFLIRK